jgi:ribose-phosphate pyrophosphokinase
MRIFHGNADPGLAYSFAKQLNIPIGQRSCVRFPNGEYHIQLLESVENQQILVIQSCVPPVHEAFFEIYHLIHVLHAGRAAHITLFMPYLAYLRQDKAPYDRNGLAFIQLLNSLPINKLITIDPHNEPFLRHYLIQPLQILYNIHYFLNDIEQYCRDEILIIIPDAGGITRTLTHLPKHYSYLLLDKCHLKPRRTSYPYHCIILDDMIESGHTVSVIAHYLRQHEAGQISAYCTHGLAQGRAWHTVAQSGLTAITSTDSLPMHPSASCALPYRRLTLAHWHSHILEV